MRFLFLFFIFFFLFSNFASAEEWTPTLFHAKRLQSILELDTEALTRTLRIKRNNLFFWATKDIEKLRRIWSLRPTFDTTLRYTPYLQKYALSCEIAALSMILQWLGSPRSEDDIIANMQIFPTAYSGGIWWDPDREFVGSITGSQRRATGYGVYAQPLIDVIQDDFFTESFSLSGLLDRDTLAQEKLSFYLRQLHSWAHILLWGDWCTRSENEDGILWNKKSQILKLFPIAGKNECQRVSENRIMKWTTPDGREISGLSWEHAFVLLGYIGKEQSPTHIIVWDTDTGRHIYPIDEWMNKWALLDYRALLIRDFE